MGGEAGKKPGMAVNVKSNSSMRCWQWGETELRLGKGPGELLELLQVSFLNPGGAWLHFLISIDFYVHAML